MKKILLTVLACLFLFTSLAFASGGKNQGDNGTGTVVVTREPAPFPWPGIDWNDEE